MPVATPSRHSRVTHAADRARNAVPEAHQTGETVRALDDTAQRIGDVVGLIQQIATIEAARAGETGKGFTIVAHEVKNLAGQTAKATEEISSQISAIQASATREITRNTNESARGTQEVSSNIQGVTEDANRTGTAAGEVHTAAGDLRRQAAVLGTEIDHFLDRIRTA